MKWNVTEGEMFSKNRLIILCGNCIESAFNEDRSSESPIGFEGEFRFMLIWEKQVLWGLHTDCAFNDFSNQAGYQKKKKKV